MSIRECAFCGNACDPSIGIARELRTDFWGGKKGITVEYAPKIVSFFCSEEHRNEFLLTGAVGGEIQTERWLTSGPD